MICAWGLLIVLLMMFKWFLDQAKKTGSAVWKYNCLHEFFLKCESECRVSVVTFLRIFFLVQIIASFSRICMCFSLE